MLFFRPLCLLGLGLGLASALDAEHPHKYDEKMSPEATFYKPSLAPYLGHGALDHGSLLGGHGGNNGGILGGHGGGTGAILDHGSIAPLYGAISGHGLGNGYDDYHKYGGIGKKAKMSQLYDHGSKGKFQYSFTYSPLFL